MRKLLVVLSSALLLGSGVFMPDTAQAAPVNDAFENATVLSGPAGQISGSNVGATAQSFEACLGLHECAIRSVWYRWIAPPSSTDPVSFSTCGAFFDPILDTIVDVWSGATVTTGFVARDDDGCGDGTWASLVTFTPVPGTTYSIRVAGLGGLTGPFMLSYPASEPIVTDTDGDGIIDEQDPDGLAAVVADASIAISGGNRNAFLGRLDYVESLILAGDMSGAVTELQALRKRVDGCGAKAEKNDWVTDCPDQLAVRSLIDSLTAALNT